MAATKGPIETKTAVGSFTGVLVALITWALVTYIPAFKSGIPDSVEILIPAAAAWLAGTIAAYQAPHTHRPDLTPPSAEASP